VRTKSNATELCTSINGFHPYRLVIKSTGFKLRETRDDVEILPASNLLDFYALNSLVSKKASYTLLDTTFPQLSPSYRIMSTVTRRTVPRDEDVVPLYPVVPIATPITSVNARVTRKLPTAVQLLLIIVLSFSTSYVLFQSLGPLTDWELRDVSKHTNNPWDYAVFPILKVLELSVGWLAGFDGTYRTSRNEKITRLTRTNRL
jgi:hypothetical protein